MDYECIPFQCIKCHIHGHLFRDYPQNDTNPSNKSKDETNQEGFSKIPSKIKAGKMETKQPRMTLE